MKKILALILAMCMVFAMCAVSASADAPASAEEAKAQGIDYEVKKLSMRYAGRFVAENEGADGLCKILVNKEHRNVIGVHMIGN